MLEAAGGLLVEQVDLEAEAREALAREQLEQLTQAEVAGVAAPEAAVLAVQVL